MPHYSYLLFDADNTLFDFDAANRNAFHAVCRQCDIPDTDETFALYERCNNAMWAAFDRGEMCIRDRKDMASRGGVKCACGSRDYGIRIHRDAVDLTCRACGGRLRLPAATDEDLDRLCCRMTLEIPGRKDGV